MESVDVSAGTGAAVRLGYRPGLDQLRGIAVLLVVIGHSLPGWPVLRPGVGVVIFFALSGFLITRLLIERPPDLRRFYSRRARRLLPALPLALAVCALASMVNGSPIVRPLIGALTYTLNYSRVGEDYGGFTHLWSLAIEEHFYLAWPLLLGALSRRWVVWLSVAACVAIGVARMVEGGSEYAYNATHLRVDAILAGALLALVATKVPPRWAVVASWAVVAVCGMRFLQLDVTRWGLTIAALASVVLVRDALEWQVRRPNLERIGRISYGIYLFHWPIAMVTWGLPGPVTVLVVTSVSILLAEVSWRLIESRLLAGEPGAADAESSGEQPIAGLVGPADLADREVPRGVGELFEQDRLPPVGGLR